MQIIKAVQKDDLIYWAYSGADRYGQPTYAAPVQMKCRWDDCRKQIFTDDGSPVFTKIELITASALTLKGVVKKGKLTASINQADPHANADVHEIMETAITPMLKTRNIYLYEAWA